MGASSALRPGGSPGNISPITATVGRSAWVRGRATGPLSASVRAYFSMAPASTSLASAWVGTPKPGTSMPMTRTPSITRGSRSSGTPEAVGTHRLMTTTAS